MQYDKKEIKTPLVVNERENEPININLDLENHAMSSLQYRVDTDSSILA